MSQRQPWSLSQIANKASGTCSVCHAARQLHVKDGTVHRHGPRNMPCAGSDKAPLSQATTPQPPPTRPVDDNSNRPSTFSLSAPAYATSPIMDHRSIGSKLIKHIPKSARSACCCRLKEKLNDVASDPNDEAKWMALLSFGNRYLQPPRRGGKRHNLTAIIRNRLNRDECDEDAPEPLVRRKQCSSNEASVMAAAVSSKIEDGNIKAAIRILTSAHNPTQIRRKHC